jgi:hypothetical protein
MNMPGMAGEAAVYKTTNHYWTTAGGSFTNNLDTTVTPQNCGLSEIAQCVGLVAIAGTVCGGFCVGCVASGFNPAVCAAAAVCVLGLAGGLAKYTTCHDCLPDFITSAVDSTLPRTGGGGPPPPRPCCPPGRRCCGSCVPLPNGAGFECDDACIGPHQVCP